MVTKQQRRAQRKKREWRHVTAEVRRQIIRLSAQGKSYRQICDEVDRPFGTVARVVAPLGGVIRPEDCQPQTGLRLDLDDRIEIHLGLAMGQSFRAIANTLDRAPSTVSREVAANGGRRHYRPVPAQRRAKTRAARPSPKPAKLAANSELCARVSADLERLHSPQQIAHRLRAEFPDRPEMWVSHETIYRSLYVQGRGELRRELAACLRTGRAARRPRGRVERRGKIADMISISERPAEIEDRAVPGHWEGDLILGKDGNSAIGTLVERTTRFVMLLHLPGRHTAEAVREAMAATIVTLPASLRRSITWDQGSEMAQHVQFSVDTDVDVYFCDPHSPWQRGSNENTNGLLRQYFPKGTDLSVHSAADLQAVADSLNDRPRETLGWMTPSEKLAELVALTA
jgi:transposase, IS30 family